MKINNNLIRVLFVLFIVLIAGMVITAFLFKANPEQQSGFAVLIILAIVAAVIGVVLVAIMLKNYAKYSGASMAKTQFLSRVSHEIRTPMNAIIGLSRMSRNSNDLSEIHSYNESILTSSVYLLALINNVLDISKIEAGHMALESTDFTPKQVFESLHSMIEPQARQKNISLSFEIAPDVPEYVRGDSTHLTQILMNLLGNAVKFTPQNGAVTLKAGVISQHQHRIQLEFVVHDTGVGIEPEDIENLFKPFEQNDSRIANEYSGSGLGLTLTKLLIEMMHGSIHVESTLGTGSTFTFDVWLDASAKVPESESAGIGTVISDKDSTIKPDCRGRVFLIVEDNEVNQMIAENMLGQYGATVEIANNGQEGLDAYLQAPEKYDAIFMDLQMPVKDGLTAAREIRASGCPRAGSIPIIAMTASVFHEDIEQTLNAGMNAHLGKPLDPDEMIKVLMKFVR